MTPRGRAPAARPADRPPQRDWQLPSLSTALTEAWLRHGAFGHRRALGEVEVLAEAVGATDSTSTRLMAVAREDDAATLRLLVAESQQAGRGRLGRAWTVAEPAPQGEPAALMVSVSLPWPDGSGPSLSLAIAAAILEALTPWVAPSRLALKWPNDLWLRDPATAWGGRKLAGLLLESTVAAGGRRIVVGLGVNLDPPAPLAPDAPYAAAGLREACADVDAVALLHAVAPAIVDAVGRHARAGLAPWQSIWTTHDLLRGRWLQAVATTAGGAAPAATVGEGLGVDPVDGAYLLADADRPPQRIHSGELSLRPVVDATTPGDRVGSAGYTARP